MRYEFGKDGINFTIRATFEEHSAVMKLNYVDAVELKSAISQYLIQINEEMECLRLKSEPLSTTESFRP